MPRKPTIDDIDDIDDEDGAVTDELNTETDLSVHPTDDPGFGGGDEGYLNDGRDDDDPSLTLEGDETRDRMP